MRSDYPVEKTVTERRSVRTFVEHSFQDEDLEVFEAYLEELGNPFSHPVTFRFIHKELDAKGEKLGTYGVIKGADYFIGAATQPGDYALEALGYSFEKLVLAAADDGYGTCWLGGTFNRGGFAKSMELQEDDLFPCISPVGRPKEKRSFGDSLARFIAKSDQRKPFEELFFQHDFQQPMTKAQAGSYGFPLEMLRLAPSAANKQPWRVVKEGSLYHFYEARTLGEHQPGVDLQKVDIGIGLCHFHLAVKERGLEGDFLKQDPGIPVPPKHTYIVTWTTK